MAIRPVETTATAPPAKPDNDGHERPGDSFTSLQDAFESALKQIEGLTDGTVSKPW